MQEDQREFHVLVDRVDREQVERLKDEADVPVAQIRRALVGESPDGFTEDSRRPPGGRIQRTHDVQERRLARTARPYKAGKLPLLEQKRDIAEGDDGGIPHRIRLHKTIGSNQR